MTVGRQGDGSLRRRPGDDQKRASIIAAQGLSEQKGRTRAQRARSRSFVTIWRRKKRTARRFASAAAIRDDRHEEFDFPDQSSVGSRRQMVPWGKAAPTRRQQREFNQRERAAAGGDEGRRPISRRSRASVFMSDDPDGRARIPPRRSPRRPSSDGRRGDRKRERKGLAGETNET